MAILPFDNHSTSMDASEIMETLVAIRLFERGYRLVPGNDVRQRLQWAGITQGGQTAALPPDALCELLGADAVFDGAVTAFSYVTLGVYQKREAGMRGALRRPDGTVLWRHAAAAKSSAVNLNAARSGKALLESLAWQLGAKLLERVLGHPLYPEAMACVQQLFRDLPGGALRRVAPMEWFVP